MHLVDERHVVTLVTEAGEMRLAGGNLNEDGDPLDRLRSRVVSELRGDATTEEAGSAFDDAFLLVESMPGDHACGTAPCAGGTMVITRTIQDVG